MALLKYYDSASGTYKDIYGVPGPVGSPGPTGPAGPKGDKGDTGSTALPSGGTTSQVLTKKSATDGDVDWSRYGTNLTLYVAQTAADLSSTYPFGISQLFLTNAQASAGGWPCGSAYCQILTFKTPDLTGSAASQWCLSDTGSAPFLYFRSGNSSAWGAWQSMAPPTQVWGAAEDAMYTGQNAGRPTYLDLAGKLRAMPDQVNELTMSSTNYPVGTTVMYLGPVQGPNWICAGNGIVVTSRNSVNYIHQWCVAAATGNTWTRFYNATTWSAWSQIAGPSATWGTAPLDTARYGGDTLLGREIYIDSNAQLRAKPEIIWNKPVTDVATTYPYGTSVMYVANADKPNWPGGQIVVTHKTSNDVIAQWCYNWSAAASKAWYRNGTSAAWAPWVQMGGFYCDDQIATAAVTLSTTAVTDLTGMTLTVPVTSTASVFLVTMNYDVQTLLANAATFVGYLNVAGTARTQQSVWVPGAAATVGARINANQTHLVTGLTAGNVVFKGQASNSIASSMRVNATHTNMIVTQIS